MSMELSACKGTSLGGKRPSCCSVLFDGCSDGKDCGCDDNDCDDEVGDDEGGDDEGGDDEGGDR
ncbi:19097_t:CDS:1, partial [Racocetra persica]